MTRSLLECNTTSSSNLFDLSAELLDEIVSYLGDTHLSTVRCLALVSRHCYSTACVWLYRNLHLRIKTRDKLRADVDKYLEILSRIQGFGHVRTMVITGRMPRLKVLENRWNQDDELRISTEDFAEEDGEDRISINHLPHPFAADRVLAVSGEEEEAWHPLLDLLPLLANLADMEFDCFNQFPPLLLRLLRQHQPRCRLHLRELRISQKQPVNVARSHPEGPDPYEMALVTSPCLRSIGFHSANFSSGKEEAVLRIVGGLAPHLKSVRVVQPFMLRNSRCSRPLPDARNLLPGMQWPGFAGLSSESSRSSLESLTLSGGWYSLERWHQCVDFTSLRYLNLSRVDRDRLMWAVDVGSFPALEELRIELYRDWTTLALNFLALFSEAAISFFVSLPPLQALILKGDVERDVFDAVLHRHGKTLRSLRLGHFRASPSLVEPRHYTRSHLNKILECCPDLQELSVIVKRSIWDQDEVEAYQILGRFTRLARLEVTLEVTAPCTVVRDRRDQPPPNDPSFTDFDNEPFSTARDAPKKGDIRNGLLHAAIDPKLARSIWLAITHDEALSRLCSIRLYPTRTDWPRHLHMFDPVVVNFIRRAYLIERIVRDDGYSVGISELGREARQSRENRRVRSWRYTQSSDTGDDTFETGSPILEVFRRTWPAKEGSASWRDDWESVPLPLDPTLQTYSQGNVTGGSA
jgi:hypothetical protein